MIRSVARQIEPVSPATPGGVVYDRFCSETATLAIAVVDATGVPVGLVERNAFILKMAAEFGRALFGKRPITAVMDPAPLLVRAGDTTASFLAGLDGSPDQLLRGFVAVEDDGRYFGVGTPLDLLIASSEENVRRAAEMETLARERLSATRRAEAANAWLRAAIEAMNEAVSFYDAEDRLVLWNGHVAESYGPGREALREGATYEDVLRQIVALGVIPQGRTDPETFIARRLAEHRAGEASLEVQFHDGRWMRTDHRALPDGGRVVVSVDVTEIKSREESFRLLFDANPVPMLVFDRESFAVIRVNETAVEQFGMEPSEVLARPVTELLPPEQRALALERVRAGGRGGPEAEITYTVTDGHGREREIVPYLRPLVFDDRPANLLAVLDVSERKAALSTMRAARDAAEAANRAKSEFLANMSHEIRTPLNGVLGVAGALARTPLSEAQREMLGLIEGSAETLQVLLSDMLDLARVEAGRLDLSCEAADVAAAARSVAGLFRAKAEEKGLAFQVEIAPAAEGWFSADVVRIKQILGNLLSNAVKFTAAGAVTLRVTAVGDPARPRLRFEVCDTGIGFDEEAKSRLFGRFQQADGSVTRRFGGSGLGLAISAALAGLMEGELSAEGAPGMGATFVLEAPLERAVAPQERAAATPPPEPVAPERPVRVLLAEDHPVNRKVIELIFEGLPVDLTCAEDGQVALDRHAQQDFDVVLMDMQMPVLDGLQATREIRRREAAEGRARTPVIMLTANALPEHEAAGRAAGADHYLTKPVVAQALLNAIEAVLTGAESGASSAAA